MSRSKEYQRLLNDRRWKQLRTEYIQTHPLCEKCKEQGIIRSSVDVHHRRPVESVHTVREMENLCYDWRNLQALCIPCHIELHRQAQSHTRDGHQQREQDRLRQWLDRHKPNADG